MMIKHSKKARVLRSLVKRETWELENVKQNFRSANDVLHKANAEFEETSRVINELSSELRRTMTAADAISIESMQMSKRYLMDRHAEQSQKRHTRQRARQVVDKVSAELKYKLLNKKGLEQVLEKEEKVLKKEREKKSLLAVEENWLRQDKGDL